MRGAKAVFLDRDGVINRYPGDTHYVTSWKKFRFLPRAKKAIAKLHARGFKLFIASNQAGINKGIYSQRTLDGITANMLSAIERAGGRIDAVYYCIHRKEERCSCRKPKTGMIDFAKKDFGVDVKRSYFIGDTIRDIETAKVAGCCAILVLSGKEKLKNKSNWHSKPDFVCKDLFAATQIILAGKRR